MDIPALSTGMSQVKLIEEVNVKLMSDMLKTQEKLGESMIRMMERSVNPNVGGNVDIRV